MNKVNEQIWNLLVLLKEPKRTRPHAIQLSSFHFNLLFRMGRLIEKKKELTADAAQQASFFSLFFINQLSFLWNEKLNWLKERRKELKKEGCSALWLSLLVMAACRGKGLRQQRKPAQGKRAAHSQLKKFGFAFSFVVGYGPAQRPMLRNKEENKAKTKQIQWRMKEEKGAQLTAADSNTNKLIYLFAAEENGPATSGAPSSPQLRGKPNAPPIFSFFMKKKRWLAAAVVLLLSLFNGQLFLLLPSIAAVGPAIEWNEEDKLIERIGWLWPEALSAKEFHFKKVFFLSISSFLASFVEKRERIELIWWKSWLNWNVVGVELGNKTYN